MWAAAAHFPPAGRKPPADYHGLAPCRCFQIDTNVVAGTAPPPPPPPPKVGGSGPAAPTKAPTPAPKTPAPAPPVKLSALQQMLAQLQKQLQAYLKNLLDKAKAAKQKPNPKGRGGRGRRLF